MGCLAVLAASIAVYLATQTRSLIDLRIYLGAAEAVRAGAPLYDFHYGSGGAGFSYPPFAALLFVPVSLLPRRLLDILVPVGTIALLGLAIRLTLAIPPLSDRLTGPGHVRRAWRLTFVATAAALWLEPVLSTLRYGQIDMLVMTLVLADMAAPQSFRGKGLAIGLAAGIKLTPAVFAVYLFATRRYRPAATAAGTFAVTVALAWAVLPRDSFRYVLHGVFLDANRVGRIEAGMNQSVRGALARLSHTVHVEGLSLICVLLVGLAGMSVAARLGRHGDEARGVLACALTGLLVSPVSWSHHWVWCAPLSLMAAVTAYHRRTRRSIAAVAACLAVFGGQIFFFIPGRDHHELHLSAPLLVLSLGYVLAALTVLAHWARTGARGVPPGTAATRGVR